MRKMLGYVGNACAAIQDVIADFFYAGVRCAVLSLGALLFLWHQVLMLEMLIRYGLVTSWLTSQAARSLAAYIKDPAAFAVFLAYIIFLPLEIWAMGRKDRFLALRATTWSLFAGCTTAYVLNHAVQFRYAFVIVMLLAYYRVAAAITNIVRTELFPRRTVPLRSTHG